MKKIIHYIILGFLTAMILFLVVTMFKPDLLLPIIEWIKSQIEVLGKWNYLVAFLSALIESLPIIGTIMPGQIVLISVGGFYGGLGVTQFIGILLSAIAGSVISNAIGYFLGKYYGEEFFKKYGMWVGIEQTELKYLKKGVNTWGSWGIILSKFHPQARAFLPFIAGSMGFLKTKFWIFNIIASVIWAVTFVVIGIFFAEYYELIIKYMGYFMLVIIFCVGIYLWKFKKESVRAYWSEKNREMEAKYKK
ncbi:DedA family protein [Candidatus Gracilibacteria bacterium]|nr:DedA family protein [Candidatus Gracilibacteria bacterium]